MGKIKGWSSVRYPAAGVSVQWDNKRSTIFVGRNLMGDGWLVAVQRGFDVNEDVDLEVIKETNTKDKAVAFARTWMRRNPNG